jgi:hypothetical protein
MEIIRRISAGERVGHYETIRQKKVDFGATSYWSTAAPVEHPGFP